MLEMRMVLVAFAVWVTISQAGLIFGWPALNLILEDEGEYRELCGKSAEDGRCADRDLAFATVFTAGVVPGTFALAFCGPLLDGVGPRAAAVLCSLLSLAGTLMLALSSSAGVDLFAVGYALIGTGGIGVHVSHFNFSNAFRGTRSIVMSTFIGSYSFSSLLYLVFYYCYLGGLSRRDIFILHSVLIGLNTFVIARVYPVHSLQTGDVASWSWQTVGISVAYASPEEVGDGGLGVMCCVGGDGGRDGGRSGDRGRGLGESGVTPVVPGGTGFPDVLPAEDGTQLKPITSPLQSTTAASTSGSARSSSTVFSPRAGATPLGAFVSSPLVMAAEDSCEEEEVDEGLMSPKLHHLTGRQQDLRGQSVKDQLFSWEFFGVTIVFSVLLLCNRFYQLSAKIQLEYLGDAETGYVYTQAFQIIGSLSLLCVPLYPLCLKYGGSALAWATTFAIVILQLIILMIPVLPLQVVAFILFSAAKQMLFSCFFGFIADTFSFASYGRLVGVAASVGGSTLILQYVLLSFTLNALAGNFLMTNIGQGVLVVLCFVFPVFLLVRPGSGLVDGSGSEADNGDRELEDRGNGGTVDASSSDSDYGKSGSARSDVTSQGPNPLGVKGVGSANSSVVWHQAGPYSGSVSISDSEEGTFDQ